MEKKSIRSVGANSDTSGHMKGTWNNIYTNNISPESASYALDNNGYTKLSGYLWTPRLYVCSFCKREFRSAQALGGHMNVHRRDRAMLRQSPPASPSSPQQLGTNVSPPMTTVADSINLNLIPNPNPNLISSSPWVIQNSKNKTTNYLTHSSIPFPKPSSSSIVSTSPGAPAKATARWSVATFTKTPNILIDANYKKHHNKPRDNVNKDWEKGELLKLGFGTSVLRKEDVDLELRLGYSSQAYLMD